MPKEAPYEWIRKLAECGPPERNAATEAKLNAVLNFVDYKGERFVYLVDAVTVLLDSTHSTEYRRRLQGCAMIGKRDDFVDKVAGGRRYTRDVHTPYIDHFRGPDPVTATAAPIAVGQPVASAGGLFVPPKDKDCAPPKPILAPHPGPAPVKPDGKRYAFVQPFTVSEINAYNDQHPTEPIRMVINQRHANWSDEPPEIKTVLCMWQVAAALGSPMRAQARVHEWICNIYRYLNWEGGVRMGTAPSPKSILEQSNFIKLALDYNMDIFTPLDGTPCHGSKTVTREEVNKYSDDLIEHSRKLHNHLESKRRFDEWMDRWHVPDAPPADECAEVAPATDTSWEARDKALRETAIELYSSDEEEGDATGESPKKKAKATVKVE